MRTRFWNGALGSLLGIALYAVPAFASTGFVDSPLWLTPDKPQDGQTATISAVFRNSENATITGTINFYDNQTLLAQRPVTIASGDVATVTADFTVSAGLHNFSATMTDANKISATGTSGPITLPAATVKMPQQFISKSILPAQAGSAADSEAQDAILKQVDKAQEVVLKAIPAPVKDSVSQTVGGVESWRIAAAQNFSSARDAAKTSIAAANDPSIKKTSTTTGKKGAIVPDNGPLTYLKLVFFTALSFLFSPFVFYIAGAFVAFLILRFLWRKLRGAFRKKPGRPSGKQDLPSKK